MLHPLSRAIAFVTLLVGAAPAFAQAPTPAPPEDARLRAREAQAKAACDGGRAPEGVRLLTELLNETKDGTYIFNLGRCYQQNGQLEQALLHFRAYLRRPDVDQRAASRAREYIAVLERPQPAGPSRPINLADPPPARASDSTRPATSLTARAAAPTPPGRGLKTAGLVLGGIGVGLLSAGVYYGFETRSLQKETDRAHAEGTITDSGWFDRQNAKGKSAMRRHWLFLGTGLASAAAGATLYYFGARAGRHDGATDRPGQARSTVVPVALPGGGGALLGGTF